MSVRLTTPSITSIVWDLTYLCPLRCSHCYSESGRRSNGGLSRFDMLRVLDELKSTKATHASLSGGEPLLVPWWDEIATELQKANIKVTLFTSGWHVVGSIAEQLADSVNEVAVSIDGVSAEVHDSIRGRRESFSRAMRALEILCEVKQRRTALGLSVYQLAIDYTVTRSGRCGLSRFVQEVSNKFPLLDSIRFGAVIPEGLAQEEAFVERELLTNSEADELLLAEQTLRSVALNDVQVSVTDSRFLMNALEYPTAGQGMAHIEPDGSLRAFTCYEAKVGSILDFSLDDLWQRALEWRQLPFVTEHLGSLRSYHEWAAATRALDRRFGSTDDRRRIAARGGVHMSLDPRSGHRGLN